MKLPIRTALLCASLLTAAAHAQVRIRPRVPLQMSIGDTSVGDPGAKVLMLESANIDRFLRKAQNFLSRKDFVGAISILQDVIEGRTLEEVGHTIEPAQGSEPEDRSRQNEQRAIKWQAEDPRNAVFSNDGRLYRPVRRLCQELLVALPPEGTALYRSLFEVAAERALAAAGAWAPAYILEEIYDRYFATVTAAKAMARAGELLMDQGNFRAAIQTFRMLLEVYPSEGRKLAGISADYIELKTALCFRKLGDRDFASQYLDALCEKNPDGALRIMGNLFSLADLDSSDLFHTPRAISVTAEFDEGLAFGDHDEPLVPLWEYRFADQAPYRPTELANRGNRSMRAIMVRGIGGDSTGRAASPKSRDYIPGTSVHFIDDEAVLMDHFRPRTCELITGRLVAEGSGPLKPPRIVRGQPRTRVPTYDFSGLRTTDNGKHLYVLVGSEKKAPKGMEAVTATSLTAFTLPDLKPSWSSKDWREYDDLTFLATPTVFNQRLLVPISYGQTIALQCLDAANGKPLFQVQIHRGGTEMARPPASQVVCADGIAYVQTNAGTLAAVDAFTGSLQWIRKYERRHPLRKHRRKRASRNRNRIFFGNQVFTELSLPGFAPSELIVSDGLVIFAPSDGEVLHCLDGASGEPVWMLSKANLQYLIGHNENYLFAGGKNSVYCIGLRSGLRLWKKTLASFPGSASWRGRGLVTNSLLIIPGNRELLVLPLANHESAWIRVELPDFQFGHKPLSGPFNVQMSDAFIALSYQGGVEVYSSADALRGMANAAQDPNSKATLLAQGGELIGAIETLQESLNSSEDQAARIGQVDRLLAYSREIALAMATHGAREDALRMLERCRKFLVNSKQVRLWHLAKLDIFRALGDVEAYSREQRHLYASMGNRKPK